MSFPNFLEMNRVRGVLIEINGYFEVILKLFLAYLTVAIGGLRNHLNKGELLPDKVIDGPLPDEVSN